jgi:hypothetical protein
VLVHGLTRHEQVHDLGAPLEDEVDAVVPHRPLDGVRDLAPARERVLGLVAAPAAHLDRLVEHLPAGDRVPLLRGGGLEADVVPAAVGHARREVGDRLHREPVRGHVAILWAIASCLPIGWPHCARSADQCGRSRARSSRRRSCPRERQPARVQGDEGDLQPLALGADEVLLRHAHVLEGQHRVREGLQAHEAAAVLDGDAGRGASTTNALIFFDPGGAP